LQAVKVTRFNKQHLPVFSVVSSV